MEQITTIPKGLLLNSPPLPPPKKNCTLALLRAQMEARRQWLFVRPRFIPETLFSFESLEMLSHFFSFLFYTTFTLPFQRNESEEPVEKKKVSQAGPPSLKKANSSAMAQVFVFWGMALKKTLYTFLSPHEPACVCTRAYMK